MGRQIIGGKAVNKPSGYSLDVIRITKCNGEDNAPKNAERSEAMAQTE
jgi:hypothetical protein